MVTPLAITDHGGKGGTWPASDFVVSLGVVSRVSERTPAENPLYHANCGDSLRNVVRAYDPGPWRMQIESLLGIEKACVRLAYRLAGSGLSRTGLAVAACVL